jgi:hypothetical protein
MFRAILCSSSGGQNCISTASGIVTLCERPCTAQRVTIPDAVEIHFDLPRMSKILLETCRGM